MLRRDDELRNVGPGRGELLSYVGQVGFVTAGQAARHVWGGDWRVASDVIRQMAYRQRLLGRLRGVVMPRGARKGRKVVAYYLTERGRRALLVSNPDVGRFARAGDPQGVNRARVPHELYCAEAVLKLSETHRVIFVVTEAEMKSQKGKQRIQWYKDFAGCPPPPASTGDLKVFMEDRTTGEKLWREVEIAINYRRLQIATKPEGMIWFCSDEQQARLIFDAKGEEAIVLGDICRPEEAQPAVSDTRARASRGTGGGLAEEALSRLGGAATISAVAAQIGLTYRGAHWQLERLRAAGRATVAKGSLRLGVSRGRDRSLYVLPGVEIGTLNYVNMFTLLSHASALLRAEGYHAREFLPEYSAVRMTRLRGTDLLLAADKCVPEAREQIEGTARRVRELADFAEAYEYDWRVAVAEPRRRALLGLEFGEGHILDLAAEREAQSYYFTEELKGRAA